MSCYFNDLPQISGLELGSSCDFPPHISFTGSRLLLDFFFFFLVQNYVNHFIQSRHSRTQSSEQIRVVCQIFLTAVMLRQTVPLNLSFVSGSFLYLLKYFSGNSVKSISKVLQFSVQKIYQEECPVDSIKIIKLQLYLLYMHVQCCT